MTCYFHREEVCFQCTQSDTIKVIQSESQQPRSERLTTVQRQVNTNGNYGLMERHSTSERRYKLKPLEMPCFHIKNLNFQKNGGVCTSLAGASPALVESSGATSTWTNTCILSPANTAFIT